MKCKETCQGLTQSPSERDLGTELWESSVQTNRTFQSNELFWLIFFLLQFPIEIGKIDQDIYKYNTPGFTGCLSRVQFNQIAPLKAALRPTNASSHVHIQGELVESNCGASPLTIPPMSAATDPWHLDSGKVGLMSH